MVNRSTAVTTEPKSVPQVVTGQAPVAEERSCPGKGILWGGLISAVLWLILIALLIPLM